MVNHSALQRKCYR